MAPQTTRWGWLGLLEGILVVTEVKTFSSVTLLIATTSVTRRRVVVHWFDSDNEAMRNIWYVHEYRIKTYRKPRQTILEKTGADTQYAD